MVDLREEPIADLREHAAIRSAFESRSSYDVRFLSGGLELVERELDAPFCKNYDAFEDPLEWPRELGTTQAVLISVFSHRHRVGGIIVAVAAPGLIAWSDGPGVAVLWDLRIDPGHRRQSIATMLLHAAQAWAGQRGYSELMAETQNTNPAACKFYLHNGFILAAARHGAYPQLPQDVQLIWRKKLDG